MMLLDFLDSIRPNYIAGLVWPANLICPMAPRFFTSAFEQVSCDTSCCICLIVCFLYKVIGLTSIAITGMNTSFVHWIHFLFIDTSLFLRIYLSFNEHLFDVFIDTSFLSWALGCFHQYIFPFIYAWLFSLFLNHFLVPYLGRFSLTR